MSWIDELKVGDNVFYGNMHWKRKTVVEKITPSRQIKLADCESKFRKDGYQFGSSGWDRTMLYQWSQEIEDELKRDRRRNVRVKYLRTFNFNKMDDEDLETVFTIAWKYKEELK
jgi:hypothetical protein